MSLPSMSTNCADRLFFSSSSDKKPCRPASLKLLDGLEISITDAQVADEWFGVLAYDVEFVPVVVKNGEEEDISNAEVSRRVEKVRKIG